MHGRIKANKTMARDRGRSQRHREDHHEAERMVHALTHVEPVSRRSLTPGTVVQARVPFTDRNEDKVRPVLVVGCTGERVVVRQITTKPNHVQRLGGGEVVDVNNRKSWLVNNAIELDRGCILSVTSSRLDAAAFCTVA